MDKFISIDDCIGKTIKDVYHDSSNAGFLFEDGTYTSFEVYRDYDDCASSDNDETSENPPTNRHWASLGFWARSTSSPLTMATSTVWNYNPSADELKLKIFDGVDENAVELTGNYDIKVSFDWN